jgi:hypothetical protein
VPELRRPYGRVSFGAQQSGPTESTNGRPSTVAHAPLSLHGCARPLQSRGTSTPSLTVVTAAVPEAYSMSGGEEGKEVVNEDGLVDLGSI